MLANTAKQSQSESDFTLVPTAVVQSTREGHTGQDL